MEEELSRIFCFGKYRGFTLHHVLEYDAKYLLWAEERGLIDLSDDLQEVASEHAEIQANARDY